MKITLFIGTFLIFALCANARTLTKRDAKSDLLAQVEEYKQKAKNEIEKLIKDNQKNAADHLQKQMDELLSVANEFKTTTATEALKLLTDKVTQLLGTFKATVNVLTDETKTKDEVIENAEKLLSNVEEEVQRLLYIGRWIPGNLLKAQGEKLKGRIESLKKASDNLAIRALELDIKLLLVRLNADLKILGFIPSTIPTTRAAPTQTSGAKTVTPPTTR